MVFITDRPSPSNESRPVRDDGDTIILEDIALLSELARPDLSPDQKQEIHLPVDLVSLEYRRRLQDPWTRTPLWSPIRNSLDA